MSREDGVYKQALRHHKQGDLNGAYTLCQKVLASRPDHLGALVLSGRVLVAAGEPAKGLPFFRRAVQIAPDKAEVRLRAGQGMAAAGMVNDAVAQLHRALELQPQLLDAHVALGRIAQENKRVHEAVPHLKAVADARPRDADAWVDLARAYQSADNPEAVAAFDRAISLGAGQAVRLERIAALFDFAPRQQAEAALAALVGDTASPPIWRELARLLFRQYQYHVALHFAERALAVEPDHRDTRFLAGLICDSLCDFAGARDHYGRLEGDDPATNNRLFTTCYDPDLSPREVFSAHREWGATVPVSSPRHANPIDPDRPLKVGYLSPDFRKHPVASFMASIMAFHHPQAVITHGYANVSSEDEVTRALRGVCHRWRDVTGLDDRQTAEAVRADGIDILVDLAGLSGGNRLRVLGHRPAPVQVSYLGYPATTGLPTVDYRITDGVANPPDTDALYTEQLVRLDGGFCCWMPPPNAPDSGPLPAARNGHITFGSLVNLKKVNGRTIALWARLLHALPDARLALIRHTLRPAANRRHYLELFARHGIGPERLDLVWEMPRDGGYLAHYQRVDVVLDTLPFCGHTSSCEALWMGVPVLTLAGADFAGRMGASVMTMLGLNEWVADTESDLLQSAQRLAADVAGLAALRANLRDRMAASPLTAGEPFTRGLEAAYRTMWRSWCLRQTA